MRGVGSLQDRAGFRFHNFQGVFRLFGLPHFCVIITCGVVIPISTPSSAFVRAHPQKFRPEARPLVVFQLKLGEEYREVIATDESFRQFLTNYEVATGCRILSRRRTQDRSHLIVEVPQVVRMTAAGEPIDKANLQTWLEEQLSEFRETSAQRELSEWQGWRKSLPRRVRVPIAGIE